MAFWREPADPYPPVSPRALRHRPSETLRPTGLPRDLGGLVDQFGRSPVLQTGGLGFKSRPVHHPLCRSPLGFEPPGGLYFYPSIGPSRPVREVVGHGAPRPNSGRPGTPSARMIHRRSPTIPRGDRRRTADVGNRSDSARELSLVLPRQFRFDLSTAINRDTRLISVRPSGCERCRPRDGRWLPRCRSELPTGHPAHAGA